jgi:ABC-type transport system substrate-binding protein
VSNFPDTNNYQLLLIGQESSIDPDQYFMWHSAQPTNFTRYKNTRIDSLLERGPQETDVTERRAIYQEFQQFLLEDPPAIFLRYLNNYSLAR